MASIISGFILNSDSLPFAVPPTVEIRQVVPQDVSNLVGQNALLLPGLVSVQTNAGGYLSLSLNSDSDGTAYEFRIITASYTQPWTVVKLFDGINYDWGDVMPTTVPDIRPDLDRSVARVAQQISSDPSLAGLLRSSIGLTPRGTYSSTASYRQGDLVEFQGASYTPKLPVTIVGIAPTVSASWQVIADRGLPGGTGGNNSPYSSPGWLADTTNAPTRSAVAGVIDSLQNQVNNRVRNDTTVTQTVQGTLLANNLASNVAVDINTASSVFVPNVASVLAYAAPINNPTFTGTAQTTTRPVADSTLAIATTEFVAKEFNRYLNNLNSSALVTHSAVYAQSNAGSLTNSNGSSFALQGIDGNTNLVTYSGGIITINPQILTAIPAAGYRFRFDSRFNANTNNFTNTSAVYWSAVMQQQLGAAAYANLTVSAAQNPTQYTWAIVTSLSARTALFTPAQITAGVRFRFILGTQGAGNTTSTFAADIHTAVSLVGFT